ncbi:MAG: hypothetical protein H6Q10_2454 [Acidobacteria bacterium]|nr:hypothetical protein [Acidobacteriota bacterium]
MRRPFVLVAGGLAVAVALLVALNLGYYAGSSYSGNYCTTCHQIQASYDRWAQSVHRGLDCKQCHGSAFTTDLDAHRTNLRHLYYQATGRIPGRIVLKDAQVDRIAANCQRCHGDNLAKWRAGGHSAAYSHIFLSRAHNAKTLLMDDCLRCHGMFADLGVAAVVTPIDNEGPWRLVNPRFAGRPVIPCLACHSVHARGTPPTAPDYLQPKAIARGRRLVTTSLGFYDRRERQHVLAADLPLPRMRAGGREVKMSPDRRQALCYQCHAPEATFAVGSGDDRTAVGVHEGIGCLGCHDPHGLDARQSCANCHPAMSNCGLDVETMDTTFKSPDSRHNIHFVACGDCHPKGVPRRPQSESRSTPQTQFRFESEVPILALAMTGNLSGQE